jgi:hypothetical protein
MEASRFVAYKCGFVGIASNQATKNLIFTNMTLIDNQYSFSGHIGVDVEAKLMV